MDGLVVLEPYATMIIDGRKSWELRSRKPPTSRVGRNIYLLSSGEILGVVKITEWSGPLSGKDLKVHFTEHQVRDPKPGLYAWNLVVIRRFARRAKYNHPRGARVWLKSVRPSSRLPSKTSQAVVDSLIPAVFGFARRNGRPLADNAPEVMFSIVVNAALSDGLHRGTATGTLRPDFPYVALPVSAGT